jgi:UDP-sulfoquinovose synthase
LHLAAHGHEVVIADNLERRRIDAELGVDSLTPIQPMLTRVNTWNMLGKGAPLRFIYLDVVEEYDHLLKVLDNFRPDAIVHFAEQRSAPYSMKSPAHKRYTVNANVNATHNVLDAIVETGITCHLVHLGTMGVYGYDGADVAIPEGYLNVTYPDLHGEAVSREILYPANPGSIYHLTKTLDQLLFQFYCKNDELRITDLHQGIVWGTQTTETRLHDNLINRFDYDGDFGTVLNRFLMQAAVGHPLTVHGTGGQTRAFINIQDTVQCIRLAVETPPEASNRVRVMNQMTECHRVRDLAKQVQAVTGADILYVDNPRREADENELIVQNDQLLKLGLEPITLRAGLLDESLNIATRFRDRCDLDKIPCVSRWTSENKLPDVSDTNAGKLSECA